MGGCGLFVAALFFYFLSFKIMAQIVKSVSGYWVGKEIHPNESYISFDKVRFRHPTDKIIEVGFDELAGDILSKLSVLISSKTPDSIIETLAAELCSDKLGMLYLLDGKSPFGVRKVLDAPV